jgi:hypothetical protein
MWAIATVPPVCSTVDSERARSRVAGATDGTDGRRTSITGLPLGYAERSSHRCRHTRCLHWSRAVGAGRWTRRLVSQDCGRAGACKDRADSAAGKRLSQCCSRCQGEVVDLRRLSGVIASRGAAIAPGLGADDGPEFAPRRSGAQPFACCGAVTRLAAPARSTHKLVLGLGGVVHCDHADDCRAASGLADAEPRDNPVAPCKRRRYGKRWRLSLLGNRPRLDSCEGGGKGTVNG